MSNDAQYILHYEPQNYVNGFPLTAIAKLQEHPDITWQTKLRQFDDYGMEFYGETKYTYPEEIRKISKADQILECKDGENWVDITKLGAA